MLPIYSILLAWGSCGKTGDRTCVDAPSGSSLPSEITLGAFTSSCESSPVNHSWEVEPVSFNAHRSISGTYVHDSFMLAADYWNSGSMTTLNLDVSGDPAVDGEGDPVGADKTDSRYVILMEDPTDTGSASYTHIVEDDIDMDVAAGWALNYGNEGATMDCDIVLLSNYYSTGTPIDWFYTAGTPGSTAVVMDYVIAHELGHCLGFQHRVSDGDSTAADLSGASIFASLLGAHAPSTIYSLDADALYYVYGDGS